MIEISAERIRRFENSAQRELRPQLTEFDPTPVRLRNMRNLALSAGSLIYLEWGLELPHPDISRALSEVATASSDEIAWLSERIQADNSYGCWALPLLADHDKNGHSMYPRVTNKSFGVKDMSAHRFTVSKLFGPLEPKEHLDHICRKHACCNPLHLEVVDHPTNMRRGAAGRRSVTGQQRLSGMF